MPTGDNRDQGRVRDRSTWLGEGMGLAVLVLLVLFAVSGLVGIEHGPDLHSLWPLPGRVALLRLGAGALVLLGANILPVYKPRGLTPYGWRWEDEQGGTQVARRSKLAA